MEYMKEIKDIPGYFITIDGKVWSERSQKFLSQFESNSGYLCVNINGGNTRKNCFIHRLVAEAFISNPNHYPVVNHKDENKQNNNVDNLEWCTYSYNLDYNNSREKGAKKRKKPIVQLDKNKNFIRFWDSACDAGNYYGYDKSHITACCKGKAKTSYGYIWVYKEDYK